MIAGVLRIGGLNGNKLTKPGTFLTFPAIVPMICVIQANYWEYNAWRHYS